MEHYIFDLWFYRIIEPESDKGLLDILWADPSNDESEIKLAQQLNSRSELEGDDGLNFLLTVTT
jgi:hypothetical protein